MIPAWAMMGIAAAATLTLRLIEAKTDEEREEALMTAAEELKRALDAKKFGAEG